MTKLLKESEIFVGAQIIKSGGTVAFRTETVYGLGADATSDLAVQKIFDAKSRPAVNPLIIHFYGIAHLIQYFPHVDQIVQDVFKKVKYGITVILPKPENFRIANRALGGLDTVAVRIPNCGFSKKFIQACGVPIAAPSANISTRPSSTRWQDVYDDLNKRVNAIFMGKPAEQGIESTVIKLNKLPNGEYEIGILRQGAVSQARLEKLLGYRTYIVEDKKEKESSPGTRFKHYSPSIPVYVSSCVRATSEFVKDKNVIILCLNSSRGKYTSKTILLGNTITSVKASFFAKLRQAEKEIITNRKRGNTGQEAIIIEELPNRPEFDSIKERISKASEGRVL
ncbi:MAG: L-threonylcarbamoyladenylate synthase [Firmicutes bacterium]|nr:L-threonylcarbamoyladenylate synthase [Bacillota bacterium]